MRDPSNHYVPLKKKPYIHLETASTNISSISIKRIESVKSSYELYHSSLFFCLTEALSLRGTEGCENGLRPQSSRGTDSIR